MKSTLSYLLIICSLFTACIGHQEESLLFYVDTRTGTAPSATHTAELFGKNTEEYGQTLPAVLEPNGMKVLLLQGQAFKNGKLLDLTAAEYKLLCLFMKNPNMVLTKEQILDKLWDCDGNYIDSSTLTVYMRRLRIKIEDNPSEPQMLLTVRGMGYKWNVIG